MWYEATTHKLNDLASHGYNRMATPGAMEVIEATIDRYGGYSKIYDKAIFNLFIN